LNKEQTGGNGKVQALSWAGGMKRRRRGKQGRGQGLWPGWRRQKSADPLAPEWLA